MHYLFVAVLALCFPIAMAAQGAPGPDDAHAVVTLPDKVAWNSAPPVLPPGAKLAVVEGNPAEAGPYTMRLLMPDRYRIPPHFHHGIEHVTVLRGTFKVGMGEKFDASAMNPLPTGAFAALPPGVRHYAEAVGETVIQLHGIGPWTLTYANPADDPQQRTP